MPTFADKWSLIHIYRCTTQLRVSVWFKFQFLLRFPFPFQFIYNKFHIQIFVFSFGRFLLFHFCCEMPFLFVPTRSFVREFLCNVNSMALCSLYCADVPLRNCSLTHSFRCSPLSVVCWHHHTRNVADAKKAHRTVYDMQYSCRTEPPKLPHLE